MTSAMVACRLEPGYETGYPTSPFTKSEDFTESWWEPGASMIFGADTHMYSVVRKSDGVEVARAKINADRDGPFAGYGVSRSLKKFVEIQFFEVAISCQRNGYGTVAVDLLMNEYSDVNLMAGSEEDKFWETLGWAKYRRLRNSQSIAFHTSGLADDQQSGIQITHQNTRPTTSSLFSRTLKAQHFSSSWAKSGVFPVRCQRSE